MSTPHRPLTTRLRLQRPPPLLLVICCLAALLAQQGVVAATPGTSSSSNDGTGTHTTAARTCVPLQGIESNATGALDPDRFLDLDVIRVSLKNNFNVSNPVGATFIECQASLETPIAMRNLLELDTALFSISGMFHPNSKALDVFGDKEASDARRRCRPGENDTDAQFLFDVHRRVIVTYTLFHFGIETLPFCTEELQLVMEEQGLAPSLIMQEDTASTDTPWGLAKTYVDEVTAYMLENDGWNADGRKSREFNRIPFSDYAARDSAGNTWTPYEPQNSPYKLTNPNRWQPLVESDGLGYLSTQEHVTPHIGVTARFFGFNSKQDEEAFASRQLDTPEYISRYEEVAQEALDESTITAEDTFKQAAISFFDNKGTSLVPLKAQFFRERPETLTVFDFQALTLATQLAVYNGVVLTWREKIRHDLPRPPTVVRDILGDTLVEAYAGPGQGVETLKASEWESFIRTMPHSEFPSASSCLCQVFTEQVRHYLGADEISPSLELGGFSFASWSEISQVCGDSRVWGGMHFEGAVPAGVELCGGGDMAVSIGHSIEGLVAGDEDAAVFKRDIGELMLRPL